MRSFVLALVMVFAACGGGGGSEQSCETSAQCSAQAPYCSAEACAATCAGDMECPGFGQSAAEQFCVGGACVACRDGMNDCTGATPVCAAGQCRRCERNDECGSGVCAADGSCVAETSVVYVSPSGSANATCTKADPCSLTRGVQLTPLRQFIVLASGTHTLPASLTISEKRSLIGSGTTRPIITATSTGPMITLAPNADVTFEHLEFTGAKVSAAGFDGFAIQIPTDGFITARVKDSVFSQNATGGIDGRKCTLEVSNSTFNSTARAIGVVDSKATIERSLFTGNSVAMFLDAGIFTVRNNFVVRNVQGVDLFANDGTIVEFNTIVDNMSGFSCQAFVPDNTALQFPNNLVARNTNMPSLFKCALTNSIITGTDIGAIKFKSPDVAPFDYHIQPGSAAADLGAASSTMTDFDGEARPAGAANDIGADELH